MDSQKFANETEDVREGIANIPHNRVLLAEKLSAGIPAKPEIVEGLANIEAVFAHFKPAIDMEFESEDGSTQKETVEFTSLADFSIKGITGQSKILRQLTRKTERYHNIIGQLKTNTQLNKVLSDKQTKEKLVLALRTLINTFHKK